MHRIELVKLHRRWTSNNVVASATMFETITAGIPEFEGGGECSPLRFCTWEGTEIEDLVKVSKMAANLSFQSYIEFTEG